MFRGLSQEIPRFQCKPYARWPGTNSRRPGADAALIGLRRMRQVVIGYRE